MSEDLREWGVRVDNPYANLAYNQFGALRLRRIGSEIIECILNDSLSELRLLRFFL